MRRGAKQVVFYVFAFHLTQGEMQSFRLSHLRISVLQLHLWRRRSCNVFGKLPKSLDTSVLDLFFENKVRIPVSMLGTQLTCKCLLHLLKRFTLINYWMTLSDL